jgi:hypothetical protein
MRHWFHENYDQPANSTPWDSEEGGYIYIWGGPYDPREQLEEEFSDMVPNAVIGELGDELFDESSDWTRHPSYEDLRQPFGTGPSEPGREGVRGSLHRARRQPLTITRPGREVHRLNPA